MSVFLLQAKRFVRVLLLPFWPFIRSHTRLRRYVLAIARRLGFCATGAKTVSVMTVADLNSRSRRIYTDLKAALEKRNKENG